MNKIDNFPLVSVIIPTYNCRDYICQAISSALDQTYKNYEIIVVDDGSTDDTSVIIKPFIDRINYYKKNNEGVSSARNVGIELSKGEIIAFLDADDIWIPHKLQIQMNIFREITSSAAVFSNFSWMNASGVINDILAIKRKYPVFRNYKIEISDIFPGSDGLCIESDGKNKSKKINVFHGNIFKSLFLGNFINTSSIAIKRTAVEDTGKFNTDLKTQEDYDYWLRLSRRIDFAYYESPLVLTRIHSEQLTRDDQKEEVAEKSLKVVLNVLKSAKEILSDKIVRTRVSDKYRSLGLVYLGMKKENEAREMIKQSLKYSPINLFSISLLIWSFMPSKLAILIKDKIKFIMKKVRPSD